ncbi:hypothetical protein A5784_11785 [Mycobacterium sp. 852013-50091_SCH5140682]|nr:hypothetical protein A5784_11785 [Mycobacterium sp. 852013-50091_SCH5140682]
MGHRGEDEVEIPGDGLAKFVGRNKISRAVQRNAVDRCGICLVHELDETALGPRCQFRDPRIVHVASFNWSARAPASLVSLTRPGQQVNRTGRCRRRGSSNHEPVQSVSTAGHPSR